MFRKILVASDGSEKAVEACREAGRMAKAFGSEIAIIHVVYIPPLYRGDLASGIIDALVEDGERILRTSKMAADEAGVTARTISLREGRPAEAILREAEAGGYDLVVLGDNGLGRAGPLELGSVSSRVARETRCSLLIVR